MPSPPIRYFLSALLTFRGADNRRTWWRWNILLLPPLLAANIIDAYMRPDGLHANLLWAMPFMFITYGFYSPALQTAWLIASTAALLRIPADYRRAKNLNVSPTAFAATLSGGLLATLLADYLTLIENPTSLTHYGLTTLCFAGALASAQLYLRLAVLPTPTTRHNPKP